ncbi:MAG: S-layer homology domain-containing protein, partial [Clostridiales Family XIII bacterium]|nr:S-layer homology domain-containing protein [Clostridiales Family XIII bacterium]
GLTDENGALTVPAANAPVGGHTLQIDKKGKMDLPDLVRLAPGYTVNVTREGASAQTPGGVSDEVYITVTGPSGSLFARGGFPWYGGITPLALLGKTGLRYETDAAGAYVKAIGGIAEFDYGPNSGWLYRVNGVETIRESAAKYRLNAGDTLEWFYTRDYTQEAGSAAWSAAPAAENAAIAVTLRPETEAVNGAAEARIADEDVKKVVAEALKSKADEIAITPKITGEASRISATLSVASLRGIANDADVKLTLKTALGDMSLSAGGLDALAALDAGESAPFTLSIEREADRVSALIVLDGKTSDRVEGGVKLRVPLPEQPTAGTVALRVREDGTEEIVLLSIAEAGALVAILDGSATIRTEDRRRAFDDVGDDAWFKGDADFVSARGLFLGTGGNAFSGDAPMTRAMLTAVFHRLAGSPAAAGNAFSDIADTAWYREAAKWAAANGIIRGMDGGFAGDRDITREQLAVTAMRFAQTLDINMGDPAELAGFTDRSAISAWADEAMRWAVGVGLLEGDAGKRLNAGAPAARAEVAAVVRRFVENWVRTL